MTTITVFPTEERIVQVKLIGPTKKPLLTICDGNGTTIDLFMADAAALDSLVADLQRAVSDACHEGKSDEQIETERWPYEVWQVKGGALVGVMLSRHSSPEEAHDVAAHTMSVEGGVWAAFSHDEVVHFLAQQGEALGDAEDRKAADAEHAA